MGKASRTKGASAEREVARELFAELGITFNRDLDQYRANGRGDLIADDADFPFLCEIKRRRVANGCEGAWEAQAFEAAQRAGLHPAIIYRGDRRPWRVRIYMDAVAESVGAAAVSTTWVETDLQGFAWIAREIMAVRAMRKGAA